MLKDLHLGLRCQLGLAEAPKILTLLKLPCQTILRLGQEVVADAPTRLSADK